MKREKVGLFPGAAAVTATVIGAVLSRQSSAPAAHQRWNGR
jgi:hypothetical protein